MPVACGQRFFFVLAFDPLADGLLGEAGEHRDLRVSQPMRFPILLLLQV